jgi:adenosylmethionine-8-amino-7-oxononanoate aminotransferase
MRNVCDEYGALLVFDEVMCGTGRTGTMHAWQHYGVAPDIQTMGKGLGAGVQPISALLYNQRVVDALQRGSGSFAHGHTYQNHAVICRVGHAVLRIVQGLLENIIRQGQLLNNLLHEELESHPNVGNIRGRGLCRGVGHWL